MPTDIKLHAYLAQMGLTSRRKAEVLIGEGRVKVNNQTAVIGQRINPQADQVTVDGKTITQSSAHRYFLVNKPVGYVSTVSDEHGRQTVLNLLPHIKDRIYPVGRLDIDSQGLMLLTNDGELTHQLTHPSYQVAKTYHVQFDRQPSDAALNHLRRGVQLKDGWTQPAQVEPVSHTEAVAPGNNWYAITIHEGRNRQVRRMVERVGYEVKQLIRVQMGPFHLDDLEGEKYCEVTPESHPEIFKKLAIISQTRKA